MATRRAHTGSVKQKFNLTLSPEARNKAQKMADALTGGNVSALIEALIKADGAASFYVAAQQEALARVAGKLTKRA